MNTLVSCVMGLLSWLIVFIFVVTKSWKRRKGGERLRPVNPTPNPLGLFAQLERWEIKGMSWIPPPVYALGGGYYLWKKRSYVRTRAFLGTACTDVTR